MIKKKKSPGIASTERASPHLLVISIQAEQKDHTQSRWVTSSEIC
jgi:hypothetical protein